MSALELPRHRRRARDAGRHPAEPRCDHPGRPLLRPDITSPATREITPPRWLRFQAHPRPTCGRWRRRPGGAGGWSRGGSPTSPKLEGVPTAKPRPAALRAAGDATAARRRLIQAGGQIAALGYAERPARRPAADASRLLLDVAAPGPVGRAAPARRSASPPTRTGPSRAPTCSPASPRWTSSRAASGPATSRCWPVSRLGENVARRAGGGVRQGQPAGGGVQPEMTRDEVIERLVSYETGVPATVQRADTIADEDADAIGRALVRIDEAPLYIEDERTLTATDVRCGAAAGARGWAPARRRGGLPGLLALPQSRTATTAQQLSRRRHAQGAGGSLCPCHPVRAAEPRGCSTGRTSARCLGRA